MRRIKFKFLFVMIIIFLAVSYIDRDNISNNVQLLSGIHNSYNIKKDNYIGYLEIPKISFKKGFFDQNNKANVVDKNITIIKPSNMPNELSGIMVIAGHSGNSKKAYFNDLIKLDVGDDIYIYYDNVKYDYIVNKVYSEKKNGNLILEKEDKMILVLTTCHNFDNDLQLIVKAYLEYREKF